MLWSQQAVLNFQGEVLEKHRNFVWISFEKGVCRKSKTELEVSLPQHPEIQYTLKKNKKSQTKPK